MIDKNGKEVKLEDYEANEIVGVEIGALGHKLWVCIDGVAVLRVVAPEIQFKDMRKKITKIFVPETYVTVDEAAKMLKLSKKVFINLANRGDIGGATIWNKKKVWYREVIEKLVKEMGEL